MQKVLLFFLVFTLSTVLLAQPAQPGIDKLLVPVVNDKQLPVADATVELLRSKDSVLIKVSITDRRSRQNKSFSLHRKYSCFVQQCGKKTGSLDIAGRSSL